MEKEGLWPIRTRIAFMTASSFSKREPELRLLGRRLKIRIGQVKGSGLGIVAIKILEHLVEPGGDSLHGRADGWRAEAVCDE